MNFITTHTIDGQEFLLNLDNVTMIETFADKYGKTRFLIRALRALEDREISEKEYTKIKAETMKVFELKGEEEIRINGLDEVLEDESRIDKAKVHTQVCFKEVQIGNQTWMSENLRINDGGDGIAVNQETGEHYYTFDAAKRIADQCEGWHLPTIAEWDLLVAIAGGRELCGNKLKSSEGWDDDGNGTNELGFSALPAGHYYGSFYNLGSNADFWTATENSSSFAYNRNFNTGASMNSNNDNKNNQYSVRLVKDSPSAKA